MNVNDRMKRALNMESSGLLVDYCVFVFVFFKQILPFDSVNVYIEVPGYYSHYFITYSIFIIFIIPVQKQVVSENRGFGNGLYLPYAIYFNL